ncbi:MAG: flavodoxin domain-containing protein [Chloroflexota bacterium]
MNKILIAYTTMTGSTAEVAQVIAEEIAKHGAQADVLPLNQVESLEPYAGVVVGAPMIMGWHRSALRFLKKHRRSLQHIPLAVFVTAMSLTRTAEMSVGGVPVFVDENLPKAPEKAGSLSFRERYATLSNYLQPILRATYPVKPASIGVFGGRLEYGRLKWWAVLFAMVIIQAQAGERRNWSAIRSWAANISSTFQLEA